jgi:hypothetical protein
MAGRGEANDPRYGRKLPTNFQVLCNARLGRAGPGKARQGMARQTTLGMVENYRRISKLSARLGTARRGGAWPGPARPGTATEPDQVRKLITTFHNITQRKMHIIQIIPANPGAHMVSVFDWSEPDSIIVEPIAFWALVETRGERVVIPCSYEEPDPAMTDDSSRFFPGLQQAEDYAQRSSAEILRKQEKK